MKNAINKSLSHIAETNDVRRVFWHMDERVEDLLFGIRQGDDSIIVGDMVVNMEGPYPLKTGRKTGLIHTCSDIVIMGGRPLFAMNAMQVDSFEQAKEVAEDLKKQSIGIGVPIIGGNTQMENDLKPCISFTIFGKLIGDPIADAGLMAGDRVLMLGQVLDGEIGERVYRAKTRFETFLDIVESKTKIHAAKDASRGGWFGNLAEMLIKSKTGIKITSIPYARISRYMGTYLMGVPPEEIDKIVSIAAKHSCPLVEVGEVIETPRIEIGEEIVVDESRMLEVSKNFPYRKPKTK